MCEILPKKCVKFALTTFEILQLLFVPRPPTGAPPLDPTGGLPSPRSRGFAPHPKPPSTAYETNE